MRLLAAYRAARDALVERLRVELEADARFTAAWLYGSLGRGDGDELSDIDLVVVVEQGFVAQICKRPWETGGQTTPERLRLFCQFGEPILIHENHQNAKPGGSFSFVRYRAGGVMVDWSLRPQMGAARAADTLLLFDKVGIALLPEQGDGPPARDEGKIAERAAFFWMMAGVTAKYLLRGDKAFVISWLVRLVDIVEEVEWMNGCAAPAEGVEGVLTGGAPLALILRGLCARMVDCAQGNAAVREQVEAWIDLAG